MRWPLNWIMSQTGPAGPVEPLPEAADSAAETAATRRFRRMRFAVPVLFLSITLAAGWRQVSAIDPLRVRDALHVVPIAPLIGIQMLALLAILAMTPYDLLIAPLLGIKRHWRAWARDAWIANTFNNMVGLAGLTGSGLRYLLAGRVKLSRRQAAGHAALVMLTIPVGLSALAWPLWLSGSVHNTWVSTGALVVAAAYLPLYLLLTGDGRLHRRFLGNLPVLPHWRQASLVGISILDWLLAALTLWLSVTAAGVNASPTQVGVAFVTAALAGVASMLPGGIGVFDGVLFLLLSSQGADSDALVAGLVMFRIVYYLVPWLIGIYLGGSVLTAGENAPLNLLLHHWRVNPLLAPLRLPLVLFSAIAVRALAYLTFAAGVVLLVYSALPGPVDEQLANWHMSLPDILLEGLHLGSVFVGVMLVILAGGIVRQVERVYHVAIPALLVGALLIMLKDFHYLQAGFLIALAILLRMQRARFYRQTLPVLSLRTARWLLAMLLSLGIYVMLGYLVDDKIWQVGILHWSASGSAHAERFLRSLLWLPLFALGIQGWLFFRLPRPDDSKPDGAALTAANEFLDKHGGSPFAHLVLAGDKQLFYAADDRVLIPYVRVRHRLVVLGDPNGDRTVFPDAIEEFYNFADRYNLEPAFYEVSETCLGLYHDLGFRLFKLGERALVPTATFTLAGKHRGSLRRSVHQAERAGVCVEMLEHPLSEALWCELQAVSDAWLDSKHAAEKGFSLGRFDRDYLQRSPLALVKQDQQVVAFASLMPAYGSREQLAIDLMRSLPTAPKGTMDILFVRLIEFARNSGYRYFELGVAPLSGVGQSRHARASEKVARLAFEHGNHFYSYKGLRSFKAKFGPQWRGVYLAYRPRTPLPGLLLDIAALISGGYHRLMREK